MMAYDKTKYQKKEYEKKDYRQELTDKVIASIENAGKWEKPWFTCSELPHNPVTGTKYKGINAISLMSAGYSDPNFMTYNNAATLEKTRIDAHNQLLKAQSDYQGEKIDIGTYKKESERIESVFLDLEKMGMADRNQPIHIKKGEAGIPVFKAIEMEFKNGDGELEADGSGKKMWMQVYAGTVFNGSQIANFKPAAGKTYEFTPHDEAELHAQAMMAKTGLKIEHNDGGRAFYSVAAHKVTMPNQDKFVPGAYYDTLLHEIGHSTGPALGRDLTGSFGSASYAKEELTAELSSIFMSAELGIPHNPATHENHAAYLKSWLGALKDDKNFIFKAASLAQKSADYQNGIRHEYKLEQGLEKQIAKAQEQTSSPSIASNAPALKLKKSPVMSM